MSTNIATMADLRTTLAAKLQQQRAALPPASGTKIRIKAKEGFIFPDGTTLDELEAVILDIRFVNALYTKRFTPGQVESPDCWSVSADATNMTPNDKSAKKASSTCDECPKNEWGSDVGGGRGKACKNTIRLAIAAPDATEKSPVYTLDLAPTSTGPLLKVLRAMDNIPYQTQIFNFSLDPKVDYAKVNSTVLGTAPDDLAPHLLDLMEKSQSLIDRGFDYDA